MKKRLQSTVMTAIIAIGGVSAAFADDAGTPFIINVDDASHVIYQTGSSSANYVTVPLQNGDNQLYQVGMEDFVITPVSGYLIESLTAYDADGNALEAHGWTFNNNTDGYSIWFTSSRKPAAKYVFKTKVDDTPIWSFTFKIDNPDALSGVVKVGNQSFTPTTETENISYKPSKGKEFSISFRALVSKVNFTKNNQAFEPAISSTAYDGVFTYKFELEDNDNISITTELAEPVFYLTIDDPSHVEVYYPADTKLENLIAGKNKFDFEKGKKLVIQEIAGYRVKDYSGDLSYSSSNDQYSHSFTEKDAGIEFSITTEEFTPPTATVTLNLDNLGIVNYLKLDKGNTFDFVLGDNTYEFRTDKLSNIEVWYKGSSYSGRILATVNGEPLSITDDFWTGTYSMIPVEENGEYRIVVRELLSGEYEGETTVTPNSDFTEWTVTYNPAGIIALADETAKATIDNQAADKVNIGENEVTFVFNQVEAGDHTFTIPAGLLTINGAESTVITREFKAETTGIDSIRDNDNFDIYSIDGRLILRNACKSDLKTLGKGLYIVGGKKAIVY